MLDRDKAERARVLVGAASISDVVDVALDRVIRAVDLRRDIAAYVATPLTGDELAVGDLPVTFDLDDADIDYDALYG